MDQDLVMRAREGDMVAFEAIYRAHSPMVYRVALRMITRAEDAEEVTQQVFLSVHRHLRDFEGASSLKTWIYRITVNCSLNALKRGKRPQEVAWAEDLDPQDPGDGAREVVDKALRDRKIAGLLDQLDPDQKMCLILRAQEGLSYAEIAASLNVPLNTVRTRIKRGREHLLELYNEGGLA